MAEPDWCRSDGKHALYAVANVTGTMLEKRRNIRDYVLFYVAIRQRGGGDGEL